MAQEQAKDVDVVIVGGGLAGLSAALRLKDSSDPKQPLSYVVLESSSVLGGRTSSQAPDRDYGGGYVGAAQNYILAFLRRFDVPTVKEYLPPDKVWLFEYKDASAKLDSFPGDDPLDLPGKDNACFGLGAIDALSILVRDYVMEPWNCPLAAQPVPGSETLSADGKTPLNYDQITVQQFIDLQAGAFAAEQAKGSGPADPRIGMSPQTIDAFVTSVRSAFSLEPRQLSLFFLLYYAATAGSYSALVDVAGGDGAAEGNRLLLGTQDLVSKLAAEVGYVPGSDQSTVLLHQKVQEIAHDETGVMVTTSSGVWKARHVIVAMSPPVSAQITYEPALTDEALNAKVPPGAVSPADRAALCAQMATTQGKTIKGFVTFKRPFWRDQDRSGFFLSAREEHDRPVDWALDNVWDPQEFRPARVSREHASEGPFYSLMTFIVGDRAAHWCKQSREERGLAVIAHLQDVFKFADDDLLYPNDRASNYDDKTWEGIPAPAAMMPTNTLSVYGRALRAPIGRMHWAGSESAREWAGYMDGAIESGCRAAQEVLDDLRRVAVEAATAAGDLGFPGGTGTAANSVNPPPAVGSVKPTAAE